VSRRKPIPSLERTVRRPRAETGETDPPDEGKAEALDSPELTNEEWLESFPIRKQLSNPSAFDCDALAHREVRRLLEGLLARGLTEDDLGRARSGSSHRVNKRLTLKLWSLCDVFDPATRVLCEKSHGSGVSTSVYKECTVCNGARFLPPLANPSRTNPTRN
jgi:hypothetical protein